MSSSAAALPYPVVDPVLGVYQLLGGSQGVLGLPVGPEVTGQLRNGGYQNFQGGAISWSPTTGVHATYGPIRQLWSDNHFEFGVLGYPTSEVTPIRDGGHFQNFEGGSVISSAAGTYLSLMPTRGVWGQYGYETGQFGYPSSAITPIRDGGSYQNYQGGAIIGWQGTAYPSLGPIRQVWSDYSFELGVLGYPTSGIGSLRDGASFQNYEGGAIISDSAGTFATFGGLRAAWGRVGYENGPMGLPTGNPSYQDPGNASQTFEGGTIRLIDGMISILYTTPPSWYVLLATVSASDVWASYRVGCPVPPADLERITFPYWDMNGGIGVGDMVVASSQADPVARTFEQAYADRFVIKKIVPVEAYAGSDVAAMQDGDSSAFNCRTVTGNPRAISQHSYGNAVDINTIQNPYVTSGTVYPAGSDTYLDRSNVRPGMIVPGDGVEQTMANLGWTWGGRWALPDYQHFSSNGG